MNTPGVEATPGTNLPRVREYNAARVLEVVRTRGTVSRTEVAQATGLVFQTVSNIVQRLLDEGLVVESDGLATRGPRSRRVSLNPDGAYAVGVQITRSAVSAVTTNLMGDVKHRQRTAHVPADGPEFLLPVVERLVKNEAKRVPEGKLLGVGVGFPGVLDLKAGTILAEPVSFTGWHDFPLQSELSRRLKLPVSVENSSTAAMLGERWKGRGKGVADLVYLYLGDGVGAGIIVNGEVCRGFRGSGGEIAHVVVEPGGAECVCGRSGCLEAYLAPRGILRLARGLNGGRPLEADTVGGLREGGFPQLGALAHVLGEYLAQVVTTIAMLLDPQRVIVGGPSAQVMGDELLEPVRKALASALSGHDLLPEVALAAVGADAGAVGAAAVVFDAFYGTTNRRLEL